MADVIFNGTDQRKALGMAEVSLTIGDMDSENLKAAGVDLAYNEVTLTRRVFRDGGSEYFLNKVPCRLKDIQQLFMGTGVGRTSYSIMAQGNITQIISSKPEDRRMVFEEAAGITKFKAQKREALRKLEYSEQNLLRVSDLIREVKRQIGSLQRQAGKARRYKQLMLELQHLDTQLARHQFDLLESEVREKESAIEKLRVEIELCSEGVLRSDEEISQLRSLLAELEEKIHAAESRGHELKNQTDRHEANIHYNEERLRELEAQNARTHTEITQGEERRSAVEQELTAVKERLSASGNALNRHRDVSRQRQDDLHRIDRELMERQEALRRAQAETFALAQQLTRVRNEITALDLQKQGNVVRLEKLSAEKIQLEEERGRLEARLNEFAATVETEKQNVQASRGTVEDRQRRLREIQQELNQAGQELDGLLRDQAERRSQLSVLEQLQSDYEGFSAGALAVLKGTQNVQGSLTDKLRVPDDYIIAVEAALGHHLQLALTEQPEAAQTILANLTANKKGRASIAALTLSRSENREASTDAAASAFVPSEAELASTQTSQETGCLRVPALSVIQADASIRPLLGRLLCDTFIVQDLAAATRVWQEQPGRFTFVTLTGEVLDRHGIYTGGSGNYSQKAPSSALGRKNQIAELQTKLGQLQERVAEASRRKGALQSEQTALQAGLQQAQADLRKHEVAIATRQGEFNALQVSLRSLHQKIDTVVYEIQSLAAQDQEALARRTALADQLRDLEARDRALQERLNSINSGLDNLRQRRDIAHAELTETKVAFAAEEQLCASLRQQEESLQNRLKELIQLVAQQRAEAADFVQRRIQCKSAMDDSRRKIEALQRERESANARLAELQSEKQVQETFIATQEEDLRVRRRRLSELQEQRGAMDVELAQKRMGIDNLRQRVREKYQVNLDDVRSECITITIADQGPPKVQTLSPEEMAASGASTDWDAVAEQVTGLQKRLDEMGPVNLVAIEEYEETEQRHQFLSTQYDDLVKAKQQLVDIINRINAQTKQMFSDTFHQVRENFRSLFTEVFGGGKADLQLVDEGDVLESGIEIVARPPGKQLQSISLLSGGEQTMTAVALLFAIYQVKPSPFCVLDELDAPLDESNINRFIRVLQRFLAHSQFVIITHNKRTIGMADVLYGVTMQEQGVSKIVSVKFHKATEQVTDHLAAPLEPLPPAPVEEEEDRLQPTSETMDVVMAN
jgi:chromosome segregation protein